VVLISAPFGLRRSNVARLRSATNYWTIVSVIEPAAHAPNRGRMYLAS
jgi:hypothetical protein